MAMLRRYLCERCGGTGQQSAGQWSGTAYDEPAGICTTCNGEGLLGAMELPEPDEDEGGYDEEEDVDIHCPRAESVPLPPGLREQTLTPEAAAQVRAMLDDPSYPTHAGREMPEA